MTRITRKTLVGIMATLAAILPMTPTAQAEVVNCNTKGTHNKKTNWEFDVSGAGPWKGTVYAKAIADGDAGPLPYTSSGTKLSWTPPAFTPGTVSVPNFVSGHLGSLASGTTTLTGKANLGYTKIYGYATANFLCGLAPVGGGTAYYEGDASDPWPFGEGGLPISGNGILDLGMSFQNTTPTYLEHGSWTASFSAYVRNIATYDDRVFFGNSEGDPPQLLYSAVFGGGPNGLFVSFSRGSPSGFTYTVDQTDEEIENSIASALLGRGTINDESFTAHLDLSGHQSATIGYYDAFQANAYELVPEPATLAFLAVGLTAFIRRGKQRTT